MGEFDCVYNFYRKKSFSSPWLRIWQLNTPEAWLIFLALVGVFVQGTIYPVFAVLFGQVLRVFTLPFNQVLQGIHVWAGMFLVIGLLSGAATFVKVHSNADSSNRILLHYYYKWDIY